MNSTKMIYKWLLILPAFCAVPFLVMQALNPALYATSDLFSFGLEALPRWLTLLLTKLTLALRSEYVLLFGLLLFVVGVDVVLHQLGVRSKKVGRIGTVVLWLLTILELILRLIDWYVNDVAPTGLYIAALILWAAQLALIAWELVLVWRSFDNN